MQASVQILASPPVGWCQPRIGRPATKRVPVPARVARKGLIWLRERGSGGLFFPKERGVKPTSAGSWWRCPLQLRG